MGVGKSRTNSILLLLLWFIEGIIVGFGAILPGISGGTLCVAFGMYRPVIETLSNPKDGIKRYGFRLCVFLLGVAAGFVGLSGVASVLLEKNTVIATCVFIGFIIGTIPELWNDAGKEGRNGKSMIAVLIAFVIMVIVLTLFKTKLSFSIAPDLFGFILCGILWGLSFIVPGLSSSTLLLFFGLYQPMLKGISNLDFTVLLPIGFGGIACVLLLSKAVGFAYKRQYSIVSHSVLGIVAATTVMILPVEDLSFPAIAVNIVFIFCGAVVSYIFTRICSRLNDKNKEK
jgi:putative membrane protein